MLAACTARRRRRLHHCARSGPAAFGHAKVIMLQQSSWPASGRQQIVRSSENTGSTCMTNDWWASAQRDGSAACWGRSRRASAGQHVLKRERRHLSSPDATVELNIQRMTRTLRQPDPAGPDRCRSRARARQRCAASAPASRHRRRTSLESGGDQHRRRQLPIKSPTCCWPLRAAMSALQAEPCELRECPAAADSSRAALREGMAGRCERCPQRCAGSCAHMMSASL